MHFDTETQIELLKKWRRNEDPAALDLLIKSNENLANKMANDLARVSGLDFEDLKQEALLGMVIAARKFDFDRGVAFTTYATNWMRQRMSKFSCSNRASIAFGKTRDSRVLFVSFGGIWASLSGKGMTMEKKYEYIAKKLSVKIESVRKYHQVVVLTGKSLDDRVGGEESKTLGEVVMGEDSDVMETFEVKDSISKFREALEEIMSENLTGHEAAVIRARYLSGDVKTYMEVSRIVGLSRQGVTNIDNRVIDKIKKILASKYGLSSRSFSF